MKKLVNKKKNRTLDMLTCGYIEEYGEICVMELRLATSWLQAEEID